MAPLPSRRSLESMKRVDLQRICKDYGVKANLKSEALIDLLLDTQTPPAPQPTRRSVSTRVPSRAGPSRVSSMIVHDVSEEEEEIDTAEQTEETQIPEPPTAPVRTRKAKELQTRLGVGKPVLAGGQGPRAVTRSSGSSRARKSRAKSSLSTKPMETTIEEASFNLQEDNLSSHGLQTTITTFQATENRAQIPDVKTMVEDAIRPLQLQIQSLKLELDQVQTIKSDITDLQVQVADICKAQKDAQAQDSPFHEILDLVKSLKEEVKQLKEDFRVSQPPSRPSTPKAKSIPPRQPPLGFGFPSVFHNVGTSVPAGTSNGPSSAFSHPGIAQSTLGKRHRNPDDESHIIDEGDQAEYSEDELAKKVVSPTKKRARTDSGDRDITFSNHEDEPEDPDHIDPSQALPTFTVFRGSEEPGDFDDPPPPTDHLPELFEPPSPPSSSSHRQRIKSAAGVPTSSANAAENQPHPFGFSYLPISSTPQNPMYMPSFPYPEPPQSPSPAGPSSGTFLGRQHDERTDIFKNFGFPSPHRSSRHYGSLTEDRGGFVNPAAISQQGASGKQREVTSNEVAAGLGLTTVRTTSSSEVAAGTTGDTPPSKKTMYGTELESDTRFGDFGVEGVASGFWTKF
ncbi:hypothetical protein CVT25_002216 [Psilocybe cyanescens]|uniref:Uncharacterized protein n=1 Tax=Psilocybe cyanescens TaxID=93625 RepID=A0A409XF32_PSICY|nr:hypothetical protein CVT25_002216 [Psilocybe cyanescens]